MGYAAGDPSLEGIERKLAAQPSIGVPTVVFGPGSIAQAHTCDEFIEIDQLEFAAKIFHRIATGTLDILGG